MRIFESKPVPELYFYLPSLTDRAFNDVLKVMGLKKKFRSLAISDEHKPIFNPKINPQAEAAWVAKAQAWPEISSAWLKLNLANFHLSQTRVYLSQIPIEVQAFEQAELLKILQICMQDLGQVYFSDQYGYYLNLTKPADLVLPNPYLNLNAELTGFKIKGQDSMLFEKALTELQMSLYQAPINKERQLNNLPSIDGAYFSADLIIKAENPSCLVDTLYTDMAVVSAMASLCQVECHFFKQDLSSLDIKCMLLGPNSRKAYCFDQKFALEEQLFGSNLLHPIFKNLQDCINKYPLAQITLVTHERTWEYQPPLWQKLKSCLLP